MKMKEDYKERKEETGAREKNDRVGDVAGALIHVHMITVASNINV